MIDYIDEKTKQCIKTWGKRHEMDAMTQLKMHFDQLIPNVLVMIADAKDDDPALIIHASSESWTGMREFLLDPKGSLWYDKPFRIKGDHSDP